MADDKRIDDYADYDDDYTPDERAEARRRRRIRNQTSAAIVVVVVLLALAVAGFFGVQYVIRLSNSQRDAQKLQQELMELENQNTEEQVVIEAPEE